MATKKPHFMLVEARFYTEISDADGKAPEQR